jgi:bifunctional UDP-N-acetylglucosamine pyrophosphorylase/glucosamine-1-phosphate N-acetyltransferase
MRSDLPKVLHKVCGAPMVRFPLDALSAAGIDRQVVVLGVGREKVEPLVAKRPGVRVAVQEAPLGTGHAVLAARPLLEDWTGDLVVLPGDAPCVTPETIERLLREHRRAEAAATVVTARCPSPLGYGRVVRDGEGRIARIVEEKDAAPHERAIDEVNSGMYVFRAERLWQALEQVRPENAAGEYYVTDVVRILLAQGLRVATVEAPFAEVEGVNDRAQLAQASAVIRDRVLSTLMRDVGVTVVDPSTTWVEVDVHVGPDTVIEPFSVVRAGARIGAGCHIGPFAHISEKVVLEDGAEIGNFVEVKRTRMGKKAKAKHLAYLGDGDVGAGANIGAGTIFCNYDGSAKHPTKVGEKAFIGSGTLLVAPVEVGASASTGAGAVVTRGKKVPAGETWIGVPARPLAGRKGKGGS